MYSKPIPGLLSPQQVWFFRHAGYLRVGNAVPKERLLWLREVIDDRVGIEDDNSAEGRHESSKTRKDGGQRSGSLLHKDHSRAGREGPEGPSYVNDSMATDHHGPPCIR